MEAKFSARNLFKLASYDKFGFSRPDLDGNKLAKRMYLVRKARDREVYKLSPVIISAIVFIGRLRQDKVGQKLQNYCLTLSTPTLFQNRKIYDPWYY